MTKPGAPRNSLKVVKVNATIASLKWSHEPYVTELKKEQCDSIDYSKQPSEDYAHATITFKDEENRTIISELSTSWSFVGAGLRLNFEMMGPEYSMTSNSLSSDLNVFISRRLTQSQHQGEDLVEKQNADGGLMPVVPCEELAYGYVGENKHMVECFLAKKQPDLTFQDGFEVVRLLMLCYYSAQKETSISPDDVDVDEFIPDVALVSNIISFLQTSTNVLVLGKMEARIMHLIRINILYILVILKTFEQRFIFLLF